MMHFFVSPFIAALVLFFVLSTPVHANDVGQPSALKPFSRISLDSGFQVNTSAYVLQAVSAASAVTESENVTTTYIPWSLAVPRQTQPDWSGLTRDTAYIIGMHWVVIGILYISPESFSGWSEEQKQSNYGDKWRSNVSQVVWDEDEFYVNYVLHPYWGATYYTRGRERGLSRSGAFWFSALQSALYEFGTEAFFEKPSIQDLIVTPVFGSLLGMYFETLRDGIKKRAGSLSVGDKTLLVITDPLGAIGHQLDRLFRVDTRISIQTTAPGSVVTTAFDAAEAPPTTARGRTVPDGQYVGFTVTMHW